MASLRLLHSLLQVLSYNDLKIEGGFKRAFATLFDQDVQTFTGTVLLNLDQLEKQLDTKEFQEIGSFNAFRHSINKKSNKMKSEKHVTSSKSGNDTHAEDADIKPVNNKEPLAKVQMTTKYNVLANGQ
ncbi:hypothetical protein Tco_1050504 [Tanacetum coccineum]